MTQNKKVELVPPPIPKSDPAYALMLISMAISAGIGAIVLHKAGKLQRINLMASIHEAVDGEIIDNSPITRDGPQRHPTGTGKDVLTITLMGGVEIELNQEEIKELVDTLETPLGLAGKSGLITVPEMVSKGN